MPDSTAKDSRRRSRSRSESDPEEERRRQWRRREREERPRERRTDEDDSDTRRDASRRSESPRDKYRDDYRHRRDGRRDENRDRDRDSREPRRHRHREDERHRDPDHRRRTEDKHAESRHSSRRHHERSPRRDRSRDRDPRLREKSPPKAIAYQKAAGPLPDQQAAFSMTSGRRPQRDDRGNTVIPFGDEPPIQKELPNFGNSGLLAAATNTVQKADGSKVVLKYHEPPEARKPSGKDAWKLFVFKEKDILDTIELHLRSCWLIGREVAVVDLPAEHPSVSKQHAVIQFRYVEKRNEFGDRIGKVKPYLIDLESANGTSLNGEQIEERRFVEVRDKDLIQFGESTREYVVMLPPKE